MSPAFAAVPEPCDGWSGRVREGIQDATAQRSRLRKAEPTRLGNRLRQQGNRSAMATGPSPAATTVAPTSALGGLPGLLRPRFPRCQEFLLLAGGGLPKSIESSDQVRCEPFVFHNDRSRVFGTLLASAMLSNTLVRSRTVNGPFTFRITRMCGRLLDAVA